MKLKVCDEGTGLKFDTLADQSYFAAPEHD